MHEHITKLNALQRNYAEAMSQRNPDLSPEGQEKAAARTREAYKAELNALISQFNREATTAQDRAAKAIPAAVGDTRQDWERAKMLLDAGASLQKIVAGAGPDTLHALTQWGPTYLQAESIKASSDAFSDAFSPSDFDPAPLQRSIRQRWAEVLDGYAPGLISRGFEAEAAAAEFQVTAQHFGNKLEGLRTASTDLDAAIGAKLAGQQARAVLTPGSANVAEVNA